MSQTEREIMGLDSPEPTVQPGLLRRADAAEWLGIGKRTLRAKASEDPELYGPDTREPRILYSLEHLEVLRQMWIQGWDREEALLRWRLTRRKMAEQFSQDQEGDDE